jgi:hypothetical protein
MTTLRQLTNFDDSQRLNPSDINQLLAAEFPEQVRDPLDIPLNEKLNGWDADDIAQDQKAEARDLEDDDLVDITANDKAPIVTAKTKKVLYFAVPGKPHFIVNMARDTAPDPSEIHEVANKELNVPYIKDIFQAMQEKQLQGIAFIPLMQQKRKHAVLLEVDLTNKTIILHDWRSRFRKLFMPDNVKNVASELQFKYQYRCYGTQDNAHLCGYYTHQAIRSILRHGDTSQLPTLEMGINDVYSKEYYLSRWSTIQLPEPKPPLSRLAKVGIALGVGVIIFGIINIWNPVGWGILSLTASIGCIAGGVALTAFSADKTRENCAPVKAGYLGFGLTGFAKASLLLGLLSSPISWGLLATGVAVLAGSYAAKKWQERQKRINTFNQLKQQFPQEEKSDTPAQSQNGSYKRFSKLMTNIDPRVAASVTIQAVWRGRCVRKKLRDSHSLHPNLPPGEKGTKSKRLGS